MRFKMIAGALAAFSLTATGFAQQAGEPEFSAEAFRAHVDYLADDLLEGRNAGERGYDLAALYVKSRFEALGLKPGAKDGWYQQVPLLEYQQSDAPAGITIGGTTFAHGKDVMLSASPREASQSIEAPVVFVGYGLDAPEQGFNDYAGLDVRGKIVAVLSGFPKGTRSDVGAHLSSQKSIAAERHGAIGVLNIFTKADSALRPWSAVTAYANIPQMTWVGPDQKAFVRAPGIRIAGGLSAQVAQALFEGAPKSLASVLNQADRQGGKPKGFALRQSVKIEQATASKELSSPNVLAMLPGSDPALANEYVLLMAHLDHDGTDETKEGDKIYNGAMDNATGIATMLEVARAMASGTRKPRRPILFAAVTAEEDGLLGAQYLARNPTVDGKVVAVVNLDMPVLLYDFSDVIAFGAEHSTLGPIVERAGARMNVALAEDPLPQEGLFTRSDHYMFVREGIPAVFLMTGFAGEGKERFTNFLATNYHKVTDDLSQPIDWNAGAKFARLNYLIAREIADAPQAPLWYEDSFFGNAMAPQASKAPRPAR